MNGLPPLRSLLVNWKLKLAAVSLAVFLWVTVTAEQPASRWISVPVEVALREMDYVLVDGPLPATVEVRFVGAGRELLELALDRPALVLPVREVDPRGQIYLLEPGMVQRPPGIGAIAQDVRPSTVRLVFAPVASRSVPVRVRTMVTEGEALVWSDSVRVEPGAVRLTGPSARLREIRVVQTEPVRLSAPDTAFRRTVALDTAGLGVDVYPARVEVTGRVDRLESRWFAALPIAAPPGLEVLPERADVRLEGSAEKLAPIRPEQLRIGVVDDSIPAGVPPADATFPLRVAGIPAGVRLIMVPTRVRLQPFGVADTAAVAIDTLAPAGSP
ncbi:MAG: CdaR family protein [Longimicrobiaceae bacterium]